MEVIPQQQKQHQQQQQKSQTSAQNDNNVRRLQDAGVATNQHGIMPSVITRERSFVRTSNHQQNKRRSLAFNNTQSHGVGGSNQLRGKPAMDIYRPPKLNLNLQHSSSSSVVFPLTTGVTNNNNNNNNNGGVIQQQQYSHINHRRQAGMSLGNNMTLMNNTAGAGKMNNILGHHRPVIVTHSHPMQYNLSNQIPLINSPSSGNILHAAANTPRVKFAVDTKNNVKNQHNNNNHLINSQNYNKKSTYPYVINYGGDSYSSAINTLQRSKSLSSADALMRGIAGLGLALGNEITDIGEFPAEIQALIDTALDDPNKLNSRALMELTSQFIKRAVEGRRYALPIARLCLNIIAKEQKETFLEALLNTCKQWYQEREKLLFIIQGMKSPSRIRLTAFMAFLTEMFCQLKRRQLQFRTQNETPGTTTPPLILLTLLSKCCEDCVKPPVRSLSEIECLFYVLTCIGQDMEVQLPQQLEVLLSLARDAFLNANDSVPAIRRTLLQLIELQASHWQLPGNTVLYYYPSS